MKELITNLLQNLGLGVNGYIANSETFSKNLTRFTNIDFTCDVPTMGTDGIDTYTFKGDNVKLTYIVKGHRIIHLNVA